VWSTRAGADFCDSSSDMLRPFLRQQDKTWPSTLHSRVPLTYRRRSHVWQSSQKAGLHRQKTDE